MDAQDKMKLGQKLWGQGLQEVIDALVAEFENHLKALAQENDELRAICTELAEKGGRDG